MRPSSSSGRFCQFTGTTDICMSACTDRVGVISLEGNQGEGEEVISPGMQKLNTIGINYLLQILTITQDCFHHA